MVIFMFLLMLIKIFYSRFFFSILQNKGEKKKKEIGMQINVIILKVGILFIEYYFIS